MASPDPFVQFLTQHQASAIAASSMSTSAISELCPILFPTLSYSDAEKAEINEWAGRSTTYLLPASKETQAYQSLNDHLASRTTVLGSKPSPADVAVYTRLAPTAKTWTPDQRTGEHGYHHVVRFLDFVQHAPDTFPITVPQHEKIVIDPSDVRFYPKPIDAREEKERKKKAKAAVAATTEASQGGQGGGPSVQGTKGAPPGTALPTRAAKKDKGGKGGKPAPAPASAIEKPLSPSLIDLRVGHILRAIAHPNADSLYVSTIACGDAAGSDNTSVDEATSLTVRTVCSGLNGLVPLSEMQGRKVVVVCNLKPVTMRGIKSAAMVLAASPRPHPTPSADGGREKEDPHAGPVELVSPPPDAEAGERVCFAGLGDSAPEPVLNPKKKVWESCQVGFTTTEACEVAFDLAAVLAVKAGAGAGAGGEGEGPLRKLVSSKSGGVCTVSTLKGAVVR
ncbi:MAG: G4 quadruplex nucleic acid binding protein [Thelocarpon superellum]|nr:MAG: G4 quadruplex nucleic acid binding protein [Thelocarpon superellum]